MLIYNPSRFPAHLAKVARARGVTVSQGLLPESFTASALDQAKQNWNFQQKFETVDHNTNRFSTCPDRKVKEFQPSQLAQWFFIWHGTWIRCITGDFWKAQFGLLDAKAHTGYLTFASRIGNFKRLQTRLTSPWRIRCHCEGRRLAGDALGHWGNQPLGLSF